jgi:O-antigen/teichoic acid export membrane protein
VALNGSEIHEPMTVETARAPLLAHLRAWLAGEDHRTVAQRTAGTAFVIRVGSAALAYGTQVLLARWMGGHEFGIFVYVWTWVMLIGGLADLGLASAAQRFIPQYAESGALSKLRGYLSGSRWMAFVIATATALLCALCIYLARGYLDEYTIVPLYLACVCLPVYGVMHVQDGIARSFNWVNLALVPPYIVRQLVVVALMAAAWLAGAPTDATSAVIIAAISIWLTALGQTFFLNRRLRKEVESGNKEYEIRNWFALSIPMFAVDSLYSMLMYVDVLVLKQFRSPEEIAIYYAALKTLSLVAFVYFAVSAASAHRFAEYHVAGDRARLDGFLRDAVRWTFWPSLGATLLLLAAGWPMLWLFGKGFVAGYHLMFIFAIGLLARASIGPAERFLVMLGEQRACALVAAAAFAVNLGLCLIFVPHFGVEGAASSITIAFVLESFLLFIVARRKLGFHIFVFGNPAR